VAISSVVLPLAHESAVDARRMARLSLWRPLGWWPLGIGRASVQIFLSKDLAKEMEKGISDSSEHRTGLQPKALQLLPVPGSSAEPAGCASGRSGTKDRRGLRYCCSYTVAAP